jgi:hypothetical protein
LDPNTEGVQVLAEPSDPAVEAAVSGVVSFGGTRFKNATRDAINAITLSVQDPAVVQTFVVFLSDGVENSVSDVAPEIADLNALGTVVYTFAVGMGSSCMDNLVALGEETGGSCTEVIDATGLAAILPRTLFPDRELAATEISLNGTPLTLDGGTEVTGDGPIDVFAEINELQIGPNEVCIKSTSTEGETAECCVAFEVA